MKRWLRAATVAMCVALVAAACGGPDDPPARGASAMAIEPGTGRILVMHWDQGAPVRQQVALSAFDRTGDLVWSARAPHSSFDLRYGDMPALVTDGRYAYSATTFEIMAFDLTSRTYVRTVCEPPALTCDSSSSGGYVDPVPVDDGVLVLRTEALWHLPAGLTGKPRELPYDPEPAIERFAADGAGRGFIARADELIALDERGRERERAPIPAPRAFDRVMTFTSSGDIVVTTPQGAELHFFDADRLTFQATVQLEQLGTHLLAAHPARGRLYALEHGGALTEVDTAHYRIARRAVLDGHIASIAVEPRSNTLVALDFDGTVTVIDLRTLLPAHTFAVPGLAAAA